MSPASRPRAPSEGVAVEVAVRDPALARRLERAIATARRVAQRAARAAVTGTAGVRVVRLRTRRRLEALGRDGVEGALVVVRVTERGAPRVPALVADLRAQGAAGVQLVWDGVVPSRERAERHVFAALEAARATPKGPPVVVARSEEPAFVLRALVAKRRERTT
ncbi:MAG TPA: hypothetical protein PLR99_19915 [Polyangiaceae bacterium]|nr:hypothetical protein [Polyangiaceae bacterium]